MDEALAEILHFLRSQSYEFVTPSPATHARVLRRSGRQSATDLRDIFGWNLPFEGSRIADDLLSAMTRADALVRDGALWRSTVRVSRLGPNLFLHSAYPTTSADAVFFGPDTYRFARVVAAHCAAARGPLTRALDIGCGSGAGGMVIARVGPEAAVTLADINAHALRYAAINAQFAGLANCSVARSDLLEGVDGRFDLIVANPPYLNDPLHRAYRHGGGALGDALSLAILQQAPARLTPGGSLLLYTGSAIVGGVDAFLRSAESALRGRTWSYEEIDPDVFGEELETPTYERADRIAVVLLTVTA